MKRATLVATLVAGGALLAVGGFYTGRSTQPTASAPGAPATAAERKPLYWHDPMVPGPRFDKPGKSPFMDMKLVPVYADEGGDAGVRISPALQQNLGIRTAMVTRASTASSFEAVGAVQFNERLDVAVQSRVAGYVEKLQVRAAMERVRPGQALATVYAPEWLGPINELLALKRTGVAPALVAAARERLKAMSVPDGLVRQSEERGIAQARYTLHAPAGGVVAELGVREGSAVSPGMTLFRIAGLEKVWAVVDVPEAQALQLKPGQKVTATAQADVTQTFTGTLAEVIPQVNPSSRTLQARFEVDNRAGRLTPGMLLRVQVAGPSVSRLLVPAEAVIRTGTRAVVIVRKGDGSFEPRDVKLGAELGEQFEVVEGLSEGDQVVASGQFLVDSEARLRSVLGGMSAASAPQGGAQ
ncbi:MAG: efflux RND transporter periplasmic adaptor subunit [Roseateles sp.]|uniref:Cu(I)/Ag(I) efflux system membrane fusion protein n=1 Tax=Roseateles asaccharophilus TaxID=582607 RepID=A0ABU2AF84_9BURK|nr:efflux RND transporter periplasmic adaptor subunit [Roseateles asaccharophilus]MDR7335872.1 Cu(I)/Ag(I) efflux system membrane fusion protein [Roseateles asaccharophilus]